MAKTRKATGTLTAAGMPKEWADLFNYYVDHVWGAGAARHLSERKEGTYPPKAEIRVQILKDWIKAAWEEGFGEESFKNTLKYFQDELADELKADTNSCTPK